MAYGLKYSYGKAALTYPYFASLVAGTGANVAEVVGIASSASALVIAGSALGLTGAINAAVAASVSTATFDSLAELEAAMSIADLGSSVLAVVGAVAIVIAAIAIGVAAGMQVFDDQQTINDLNNLNNTLERFTIRLAYEENF